MKDEPNDPADQMKRGERYKPEVVKISFKFSFAAIKAFFGWVKIK